MFGIFVQQREDLFLFFWYLLFFLSCHPSAQEEMCAEVINSSSDDCATQLHFQKRVLFTWRWATGTKIFNWFIWGQGSPMGWDLNWTDFSLIWLEALSVVFLRITRWILLLLYSGVLVNACTLLMHKCRYATCAWRAINHLTTAEKSFSLWSNSWLNSKSE